MPTVMLKRDWPGNFRRSVRDEKDRVVKVLEFAPGVPVDLDAQEAAAVAADVGVCLVPCDDRGRPLKAAPQEVPAPELEREPEKEAVLQAADARAAAAAEPPDELPEPPPKPETGKRKAGRS